MLENSFYQAINCFMNCIFKARLPSAKESNLNRIGCRRTNSINFTGIRFKNRQYRIMKKKIRNTSRTRRPLLHSETD